MHRYFGVQQFYLLIFRAETNGDDLGILMSKLGAMGARELANGQWWSMIATAFYP